MLELTAQLTDSEDKALTIRVGETITSENELDAFDCVAMSARYDNGFGFSQLYRFVDDKQSQEIKKFCNLVKDGGRTQLLPMLSSGRWWVIITPIVKGNGKAEKIACESIMRDVFHISQAPRVKASKMLISQYRYMFGYREQQFNGVFEAIKKLQKTTFGDLSMIYFEIDARYKDRFNEQVKHILLENGDGCK